MKIIYISLMWSAFIFIGYNILTAEATIVPNEALGSTEEEEEEKYDYDSYEEYNEIIEPICNDRGGKLNHGDGYCYFDERDKELQFEKELEDRGLGADYTAEEEASWNQKAAAAQEGCEQANGDWIDGECSFIEDRQARAEEEQSSKQICKDHGGKWKGNECTFPNDNERQDDEVGFDHTMEEEGLWDRYAAEQKQEQQEQNDIPPADNRKNVMGYEASEKIEVGQGQEQEEQDYEAPPPEEEENDYWPNTSGYMNSEPIIATTEEEEEELPNVLASPIITKIDDEGKRYENPDGGVPLHEDELTEDEKDDYTEYKPEKEEEQQQIEDWGNTVTTNNEVEEENDEPTTDDENNTEEINDDEPEEEEELDDNSEEEQEESDDGGEDESSE